MHESDRVSAIPAGSVVMGSHTDDSPDTHSYGSHCAARVELATQGQRAGLDTRSPRQERTPGIEGRARKADRGFGDMENPRGHDDGDREGIDEGRGNPREAVA